MLCPEDTEEKLFEKLIKDLEKQSDNLKYIKRDFSTADFKSVEDNIKSSTMKSFSASMDEELKEVQMVCLKGEGCESLLELKPAEPHEFFLLMTEEEYFTKIEAISDLAENSEFSFQDQISEPERLPEPLYCLNSSSSELPRNVYNLDCEGFSALGKFETDQINEIKKTSSQSGLVKRLEDGTSFFIDLKRKESRELRAEKGTKIVTPSQSAYLVRLVKKSFGDFTHSDVKEALTYLK